MEHVRWIKRVLELSKVTNILSKFCFDLTKTFLYGVVFVFSILTYLETPFFRFPLVCLVILNDHLCISQGLPAVYLKQLNVMMKEMEEYYNRPTSVSEVNLIFTVTSSSADPIYFNLHMIFAFLRDAGTKYFGSYKCYQILNICMQFKWRDYSHYCPCVLW